jgi:hypothetical protein
MRMCGSRLTFGGGGDGRLEDLDDFLPGETRDQLRGLQQKER